MIINEPLKSLSWKEPYGSLMLPPFNKIETRTWPTKYRGLVLMCASKQSYPWSTVHSISGVEQFNRILESVNPPPKGHGQPWYADYHGLAFAIGRLVDCRHMKKQDEDKCFVEYLGQWTEINALTGRERSMRLWCHIYEDVKPIKPIAWKGSQGFRNVSQEVISQLEFL